MVKEKGFSLVEIMISLFLSTILLTALIEHYLSAKKQYNQAHILLEEALEFEWVEELIRDASHRAGFTPCVSLKWLMSEDEHNKKLQAIDLVDDKGSGFTINHMSERFDSISVFRDRELIVSGDNHYSPGEKILIADCHHAEINEVVVEHRMHDKTFLGLKKNLHFDYEKPCYLGAWVQERFFIRTNQQGNKALYYQNGHAEELTAQVSDLSFMVDKHHGFTLLTVFLKLTNQKMMTLETMVRAV